MSSASGAGRSHRSASRCASSEGPSTPRSRARSRSAGTAQVRSQLGRSMTSTTSSQAISETRSSPESFHPESRRLAASSSTIAARAEANHGLGELHSRHRSTGCTVGAPQRAHSGARRRSSASWHAPQQSAPGRRQTRQRTGIRTSRRRGTTPRFRGPDAPVQRSRAPRSMRYRGTPADRFGLIAHGVQDLALPREGNARSHAKTTHGRPTDNELELRTYRGDEGEGQP